MYEDNSKKVNFVIFWEVYRALLVDLTPYNSTKYAVAYHETL